MTTGCGNCAVAEMRINTVEYARRNCKWNEMTTCNHPGDCVCGVMNPNDYVNFPLKTWVDLPAGINTIEVYGVRVGRSSVESQLEAAVWRKICPPISTNVICIPAGVIAELGLCEFERLGALYGVMVGCLEVVGQCSQGPDTYLAELECLPETEPDGCVVKDGGLPGGGVLLNTIALNYAYDVRVQLTWHTAFMQDSPTFTVCAPC